MCKTHIFQQLAKNKKFRGSISQSTVVCLSARARHNMFFLTTSGNKRAPQKEIKSSSRVVVSRIPGLINIRISTEVKGGVCREVKIMKHSTLDIAENVNHCSIVYKVGSSQELTHQMDSMSNIRAGYSEID